MNACIMQPTYLSWIGYYYLINKSDNFVFLDDVQYSKNTWINRNQILYNGKKTWLTVPVKNHSLNTNISEINIDNSKLWAKNHLEKISLSYKRHKYFNDLNVILHVLNENQFDNLADLNITLIKEICKSLDFKKTFHRSSEFNIKKKRTEKLIDILKKLNADTYLSPLGAANYLQQDKFEEKTNTRLIFSNFKCTEYLQFNTTIFIEKLSIIDIIANIGLINTKKYIQSQE